MLEEPILRVAIAAPLRTLFDYLPPPGARSQSLRPGVRLRVPFGAGQRIGVLVELVQSSQFDKLKPVIEVLDQEPLLGAKDLELLCWAARYYQHPLGEVITAALPTRLRRGKALATTGMLEWRITELGRQQIEKLGNNRHRQRQLLLRLSQEPLLDRLLAQLFSGSRTVIKRLLEQGWVECREVDEKQASTALLSTPPQLNSEQLTAVSQVHANGEGFGCYLLDGITGSGKTEVYFSLLQWVLERDGQALLLVPEIGLTPQLVARLEQRFGCRLGVLHSAMGEVEREQVWHGVRSGDISLLLGTRSALFTPMPNLSLIIVDEEHDLSFKQQEGFRYSARDVAVRRAQQANCPIVLGSATPSLESLHNALSGRYQHLKLRQRAGGARAPSMDLLDVRSVRLQAGVSPVLLEQMQQELAQGNQVLLFLNRRGYAPVLACHDCGWVAECRRCDARMTLHAGSVRLWCHHCGSQRPIPRQCPECNGSKVRALGQGTERLEEMLQQHFSDYGVVRIDRDSTRRKGALEKSLKEIAEGRYQVLLGTQMLAKGHHFPGVTLVGILNIDQGLFGADFRAAERMAQQVIQVAGRSGRAEKPGRVIVQTWHPDNPMLQLLVRAGYAAFARELLQERRDAQFPPYAYQALLRAEAGDAAQPKAFLEQALELAQQLEGSNVECWGPVPAPMERRAGRYRSQLMLQAQSRADLQRLLPGWLAQLEALKVSRRVRWSIDVDPQEMY